MKVAVFISARTILARWTTRNRPYYLQTRTPGLRLAKIVRLMSVPLGEFQVYAQFAKCPDTQRVRKENAANQQTMSFPFHAQQDEMRTNEGLVRDPPEQTVPIA